MNTHMMAEIVASLRWQAFPSNASDMLGQMKHYYLSCKSNPSAMMMWNPDIFVDLINQFVYNVVDPRNIKQTTLSAVQQLQLAHIIVNFLSFPGDDTDRQALFNCVFYTVNFQKGDVPLRILGLVTSLAIAFRKPDVLQCVALWMTTAGLEHPSVISTALDVSRDFVTDEYPDKYHYLPQRAYLFTAVFLIAIGKAYKVTPPPQRLLDQVTVWIESTPRVCFIPPQSAVFELFRWSSQSSTTSLSQLPDEGLEQSRLHLALMSAIDRAGKGAQLQVIPHIMTLIQELRVKRERAIKASSNGNGASSGAHYAQVERGMNMLFQLIQMLISAECLDRNEIHPIFEASEEALLPRTELYEMMKSIYFR